MKFSPEVIMANLRKRKESALSAPEVRPKRSHQEGPSLPVVPTTGLPEATLLGNDGGEKDLPTGVPSGGPSRESPPVTVSPPVGDTGEPPQSRRAISIETSASTESVGGILPGHQPPQGMDAGVPSDVPVSSVGESQRRCRELARKSRLSETVLKLAVLPKFQATMKALPLEESFDTMFSAALQLSNGLFVLRDDLVSTKSELTNAKSLIESLKKELSETNARESEARARESKALDDLQTVQEDSRTWRERTERELRILDTKFCEVMARLLPTEERLKETTLKLEHTEGRADEAEAAARDAAEKLILAEKEAKEALDKAAAAEAKARKAVLDYKSSPDFAAECNEAVMDAFVQGFERCKKRLSHHFQLRGLERFQPDEEESFGMEVERVTGGPVATEAPARDPPVVEGPAAVPAEEGEGPRSEADT